MTFDATDELSNMNRNDTATNRSDKEKARPLEMGPIAQFMKAEQKQMNHPSFPLTKVTEDLEKELNLDFSHDDNVVGEKKLIPKKGY